MKNPFLIVGLLIASGCATPVVAQPVPNPVREMQNIAALGNQFTNMVCAGVPANRCRSYRNMLGAGLTVTGLWVDGGPAPIYPAGSYLPLAKLDFRQQTTVALRGCPEVGYDVNGSKFCRFKIMAEAYETVELAGPMMDPRMNELMTTVAVDEAYRHCYAVTIDVYSSWDKNPVSHHRKDDEVRCPSNTYPKNTIAKK